MELHTENVQAVIKDCLFKDHELPRENQRGWAQEPGNAILVEGIVGSFAFHPKRLEKNKPIITDWINKLRDEFDDGYSFLAMCETKDGEQWTGLQRAMDELACTTAILKGLKGQT